MIKIHEAFSGPITYTQFIFPGGEVSVKLDCNYIDNDVEITANLQSPKDIIELLMVTDALRQINNKVKIDLILPYVPYARQDRVSVPGEAFSIKVFSNLINSQNYENVVVWDPHSFVTPALINNVVVIPQEDFVVNIDGINWKNTILVSPDAGALSKVFKSAGRIPVVQVVTATKIRDSHTGKITETKVDMQYNTTKDFLIVDDICDGGRTFIELAKVVKPFTSGKVNLYVTHGIFSKGLGVFDGLIDNIYCANPWFQDKRIINV